MFGTEVRAPQSAILLNGQYIPGVTRIEVSNNSYLGADRYRLSFALSATGYDVWTSNSIDLDVQLSTSDTWTSLIVGPVDRVEVDVGQGLVHVDGRDLSARFIEARTQETFENQTASDVVQLLASRRGLIANVSPMRDMVGRYFGGDHARTTLDQHSSITTEWDLLVKLAEGASQDVWVQGQTLNFMPFSPGPPSVLLTPQDCKGLRLERVVALSSGLRVIVKSWDCRSGQAVAQIASTPASAATSRDYVVVRPNLTATAAAALAQRILSGMVRNARTVGFEVPGDLVMQPRQVLSLAGTMTDFDGVYVVTSVDRHVSFQNGFTQTVEARTPPWTVSSTS